MSPLLQVPAWLLLGLLLGTAVAQEAPPPAAPVEAAAAIAGEMTAFGQNLELLRRFMGVPETPEIDIGVRSELPRDQYFQAINLWKKADRLLFEVNRTHGSSPQPVPGDIEIDDILAPLRDAHEALQRVMRNLQMTPVALEPAPSPTENRQLFTALLTLNRRIDALLERHFAPRDVYMEIMLATAYASRLLGRYPDVDGTLVEPPFEPYRQPADVYQRLISCLDSIIRIFHALDLPVLEIDSSRVAPAGLTPGDVFAVASLIVSQLDFLYKRMGMGISKIPPRPVYPGLKFPAHSYQRAGLLRAQLEQLERHVPAVRSGSAGHGSAHPIH